MDTFKEKHIEKMMLMYGMTHEEVILSLSPDFDERYIDLTTRHEYGECTMCEQKFSYIDKVLIPLLERINSLNDVIVTSQSCQCNPFGWVCINFTYVGFYLFVHALDVLYQQKHDIDVDGYSGFYSHFSGFYSHYPLKLNAKEHLKLVVANFSGTDSASFVIYWTFQRNMLDILCNEFDELVKE